MYGTPYLYSHFGGLTYENQLVLSSCVGTEADLMHCSRTSFAANRCTVARIAGVSCGIIKHSTHETRLHNLHFSVIMGIHCMYIKLLLKLMAFNSVLHNRC